MDWVHGHYLLEHAPCENMVEIQIFRRLRTREPSHEMALLIMMMASPFVEGWDKISLLTEMKATRVEGDIEVFGRQIIAA
jgi:hypothetical protein